MNHFFENENLSLSCMGREAQKLLGEEWSRDGKLRLKKNRLWPFSSECLDRDSAEVTFSGRLFQSADVAD